MKRVLILALTACLVALLLLSSGCKAVKDAEWYLHHESASAGELFTSLPMHKVKVGDITVGYKTYGSGPALFMIPAYSMTMDVWDPNFLTKLATKHKVILFDNRGMGSTSAGTKQFTIDQFGDDTAGLIRALGYKQADVLGWSIGGDIALSLVVNHPGVVNRLISDAGDCGGTQKVDLPKYHQVLQQLSRAGAAGPMADMLGALFPAWWMEAHPNYWKDFPFPVEKTDPANVVKQDHAYNVWAGVYDRLPEVKKPVLIVTGTDDVSTPPQNARILADRIPGNKLVEFPGAGHGLNYMYPIGFANVVLDFLQ